MNSFYKNLIKLITSSLASRLVLLTAMPVITRYYSPEDLGNLNSFIAIVTVAVSFSSLRYSILIPIMKTSKEMVNLIFACFLFIFSFFFVFLFLFAFFHDYILDAVNIEIPNWLWFLFPFAFLLYSVFEIFSLWFVKEAKFNSLAINNLIGSVVNATLKIISGIIGLPPVFLIVSHVSSQLVQSLMMFFVFIKNMFGSLQNIDRAYALHLLKTNLDVPLYRLPSQVLLVLSTSIPVVFILNIYGSNLAGQFSLAYSMLNIPVGIVGKSIGQVFYSEVARLGTSKTRKIRMLSIGLLKKLFFFSLIPFAIIYLFGEDIFTITFGTEWQLSGELASIMSIYVVSNLLASPLMFILNVYEKNNWFFYINLMRFSVIILVFVSSYYFSLSVEVCLFLFSLGLAFSYFFSSYLTLNLLKTKSMEA
ncbi:oligosaccharide flippase family protein [Vibrio sp. Isolate33]|uniref:lipopolysaccharide biosynthesis protein n=1 Tax=Vibrio sp. Isolate33 TaxID=2908539 RepID=UPI001EFEBA0A|nr:oligosaccharide flippase family protein [Vibrio sp. Isolate33]MCG9544445.1 oligosaccharide flippase family protein [Vibrio sp. Isolate33]